MKEHQHIEWKKEWRDEYLRLICGFANAEGGILVIGRDDNGKAIGDNDPDQRLSPEPDPTCDKNLMFC
jgi:ATP-dependent DNA helicase RecG